MLLSISLILLVGMSVGWICALIIILTRAGLGLDLSGLKKIGRPAVFMCFVPASLELLGILLIAPKLLGISLLEAAILGAVLAAVSPAVVVPRMVKLMEEGYGVREGIPQLILAGASVDDEAAILGAVLAAVSPAVVVPRMVKLMEEGYGVREGIPQLILAGASVDDVYVIVLFSTFLGMIQGESA